MSSSNGDPRFGEEYNFRGTFGERVTARIGHMPNGKRNVCLRGSDPMNIPVEILKELADWASRP